MDKNKLETIKPIKVKEVFKNANYVVPIYQRNYAWGELQIEQLIEDILSNNTESYFLGTLIINQNGDKFEVIDGQQRLTTLFLLLKSLLKLKEIGITVDDSSLRFEARHKSNYSLSNIDQDTYDPQLGSPEIKSGWDIINLYIQKNNDILVKEIINKLDNVFIIRIFTPENIDLNHYFEIMNTRGEQLEAHEIIKGKILAKLTTDKDKIVASKIWEACSDMNSYVQMNFDISARNCIFDDNWNGLCNDISNFDDIVKEFSIDETPQNEDESQSLLNKLEKIKKNQFKFNNTSNKNNDEENERFESVISFPNFLLQVNAIIASSQDSDDSLDDKRLIQMLEKFYSDTEEQAKNFLFNLLKYRILFDKCIIKREFISDYKAEGKWSLKQLKKTNSENQGYYINTFNDTSNQDDNSGCSISYKKLRTLQSCLRITYTSPKTMHWITQALQLDKFSVETIINRLENYCRQKIKVSNYKDKTGFNIERIVFTYLDYLLYRDEHVKLTQEWYFQFRNSIEHFYPQNPDIGNKWEVSDLNSFGNLALITVTGNSQFSNLPPESKKGRTNIINQSLKLIKMTEKMNDKGWTPELSKSHEKEMFDILETDLEKYNN